MTAIIIINETHSLLPKQEELLRERFDDFELLRVPSRGWTRSEMEKVLKELYGRNVVFVSPIPYMVASLSFYAGFARGKDFYGEPGRVFIFHNDRRRKEEIDGRIISKIDPKGWELIEIG